MDKKGISFVLVMILLLVMSSVGLAFVYWLYPEMHQAVKQRSSIAAIDYCQSATQWAIAQMKNRPDSWTDVNENYEKDAGEEVQPGFSKKDNRYAQLEKYWGDDHQDDKPFTLSLLIRAKDEKGLVERYIPVWVKIEEVYSTLAARE